MKRHQHRPFYQFSDGGETPQLVGRYVGSGLLDGQGDLNLYNALTTVFAKDSSGFQRLASALQHSVTSFGSHHLMCNPTESNDTDNNKMTNLTAFVATIPGVPAINYTTLKKNELKNKISHLFQLRSQHMSLLYGDLNILQADETSLVYQRSYFTETTIVVFNNGAQSKSVTVKVNASLNGRLAAQFGNKFSQKGDTLTVQLPAKSFEIFVAPAN